jgi:hypothetical protein
VEVAGDGMTRPPVFTHERVLVVGDAAGSPLMFEHERVVLVVPGATALSCVVNASGWWWFWMMRPCRVVPWPSRERVVLVLVLVVVVVSHLCSCAGRVVVIGGQ